MAMVENFLTVIRSFEDNRENSRGYTFNVRPPSHFVQIGDLIEWIDVKSEGHVSRARNDGARSAKAEWFLFVDEDCNIPPDFFFKLIGELKNAAAGGKNANQEVIWGALYNRNTSGGIFSSSYNWIQRSWVKFSLAANRSFSHLNLLGGCMLVHRSVFEKLNGFNEKIPWAGEETEFLRRAQGLSLPTRLLQTVSVDHEKTLSLGGFFRRAWAQGFAKGRHRLHTQVSIRENFRFAMSFRNFDSLSVGEAFFVVSFLAVMQVASIMGSFKSSIKF